MINDASTISKPNDLKCNILLFINDLPLSSVKLYKQILLLQYLHPSLIQVLLKLLLVVDFPVIALRCVQQIAFNSVYPESVFFVDV